MSADDHNGPEMTGPELEGDERLAAEYAMGLLEGEELLATRGRMANEPAFAGLVARWEQQLMPLLDDVADAAPSPEVWERIASEFEQTAGEDSPVVILQRRVTLWQRIAAGSAVAAVAALALLFVPIANTVDDRPAPASDAPPLVASIPIADTPLRIGVTFLPDRDDMLVAADGLTTDGVHDHELWLVPPGEGAQVQSLGVVAPGTQKRVHLDAGLAQSMRDGAQILLSREPLGGAPDKSAPGPVVAEGTLQKT
ncbi:anti-sigma factor [Citromicrobium bathyomarinum]|uniref:anti-sigma factor n=1 Tax=Citromicrobium bathyomarinum TaxID=72174 RepID=UPI00315AEFE6